MLYTDPVALPQPADVPDESHTHVKVYRKPGQAEYGVGEQVEAFHWGGLTSGSWLSAFWVLLLPFSFANVAGWTARNRKPWTVRLVRLYGLVLTGVFLNLTVMATIDFFWQWSYGRVADWLSWFKDNRQIVVAVLFLVVGWGFWGVVSMASTRSHFSSLTGSDRRRLLWGPTPDDMLPPVKGSPMADAWVDPAGRPIVDNVLWRAHGILHRLRRIHFGFGFLMLAFAAAAATDTGWQIGSWSLFDWPTAIVLVLIGLNLTALLATRPAASAANTPTRWLTTFQPHIGAIALVGASILLWRFDIEQPDHWAHLRDTSTFLLIVASVSLLLVWATAGKVSASAGSLGTFFGVVLGAAAIFSLSGVLGESGQVVEGLNWLAGGVFIWLLVLVCVLLWMIVTRIDTSERKLWDAIHDVTGDLTSLWIWLPAVGLAAAALTVWRRCSGRGPDESWFEACIQTGHLTSLPSNALGLLATTLAGLALLLAVWMFLRASMPRWGIGALVGVPLVFFVLRLTGIEVLGIDFSFTDFETAAQTFAIVLPAGLLISRMVIGARGGAETRRGFAVIWDVVMFWPRWFHPLAPPAYGPHVVTRLRQEIERRREPKTNGAPQCPLVVAAHSQGTVIALVALAGMAETTPASPTAFRCGKPEGLANMGVLTYGCPVDHLYNSYFPSSGFTQIAAAVAEALDASGDDAAKRRWANLHRSTDPIGGPLLDSINVDIPDPVIVDGEEVYRMHSFYEPTEKFRENRKDIVANLGDPC
jgi:hypothetical protein